MKRFPLETSIISAIMHHPELTHRVFVNSNWFPVQNLRAIFMAVASFATEGPDSWDKHAKDYGYHGQYHEVEALYEQKCPIKDLKTYSQYVNSLESDYNDRVLNLLTQRQHRHPTQSNLDEIIGVATHAKQLSSKSATPTDSTADAVKSVLYDLRHPKPVGLKTYRQLDDLMDGGIPGSSLITIAASTGVGKTAYAVNIASELMSREGAERKKLRERGMPDNGNVRIDFFSLEMTGRQVLDRFITRATTISKWHLADPDERLSKPYKNVVGNAAEWFLHCGLHIYTDQYDSDQIISTIRHNAQGRKPNTYIAIIDYVGLVDSNNSNPNESRAYSIGHAVREFHNLTNDYNIPIIELAQLNRNATLRDDKKPILTDIRETGAIAQHSNVVILLSKCKNVDKKIGDTTNYGYIRARVAKNRSGKMGTIKYFFCKNQMTMYENDMLPGAIAEGRLSSDWHDRVFTKRDTGNDQNKQPQMPQPKQ